MRTPSRWEGPSASTVSTRRHKLTARERIELLFDAGTFVEFGLLAHQHSMTGARHRAGSDACGRRRHGRRARRRPPRVLRRLRLHGHGGVDGHDRRAEGRPPAQEVDAQPAPDDLAARLRRRPHSGGGREHVCRQRRALLRAGPDERSRPAGGRDARTVRRRDRLHPGARGFRAHGQGDEQHVARRRAPGQSRNRRGDDRPRDGRQPDPLLHQRRRRPRGR